MGSDHPESLAPSLEFLYGGDKRVAVFLGATHGNNPRGNHVGVRQQVACDFLVDFVGRTADGLGNRTGVTPCRHLTHGQMHPPFQQTIQLTVVDVGFWNCSPYLDHIASL